MENLPYLLASITIVGILFRISQPALSLIYLECNRRNKNYSDNFVIQYSLPNNVLIFLTASCSIYTAMLWLSGMPVQSIHTDNGILFLQVLAMPFVVWLCFILKEAANRDKNKENSFDQVP